MKHPRLLSTLSAWGLLACISLVAICPQRAVAQAGVGQTYVIMNTDAIGNFVSRGVMTLHTDHTMSVVDSGQGGPTLFFSSQLGTWGFSPTVGALVGRTLDFDFAPSTDIARADYVLKFGPGGTITGTIKLSTFPLTANRLAAAARLLGRSTLQVSQWHYLKSRCSISNVLRV